MNYRVIRNIIGKLMIIIAFLMVLPLLVSIIYKESIRNSLAFIIPIVGLSIIGLMFNIKKPKDTNIVAKEGFLIVGLSWIVMALAGSIPLMISKEIPNFFDAFFEISSGFTTTGASIVKDVEELSHSILFWRSLSHWIGGMGVLVFILAIIPESKDGSSMHILRAESPGPQVGKLVSKMKLTSRILYLIYMILTVILLLLLWCGPDKKMNLFNSIIYSIGTAGTGGFSIDGTSLELYSSYSQYVIAIFMFIFGINFTLFYLLLIGNFKEVTKSEELKWYFGIIIASIAIIVYSIYPLYNKFSVAFRLGFFQVATLISTTGYSTVNYDVWPVVSKWVLVMLMFFGSCAGSTAGGIKISRIVILIKSSIVKIGKIVNPRKVKIINFNGKPLDNETIESVQGFFIMYILVFVLCIFLISFDGFDFETNVTASLACISNIGPGLSKVGPYGNYGNFSYFSKFILSIEMIAGRLELFPILILFSPKTYRSRLS